MAKTFPLPEVTQPDWIPLNPAAGFLRVREYSPIQIDEFMDSLGGANPADLGGWHLVGDTRPSERQAHRTSRWLGAVACSG